ncbi:MAG TPA: restriction endonuclease, partial [Candidatus Fimivivens sp.]|nr:restriction endonuclease [Candidatus Fimivivens sp.]
IDAHNNDIQKKKEGYEGKTERGVAGYFELVLERSNYPASLTIFPSVFFEKSSSVLLVDMELPSADKFISTIEYKYVPGKNEIVGKGMNKKEFEEFYNDVIYKVALRTIHEICESDYVNAVETIVFNGWVDATDPKTGKQMRNCIASLQVMKKEYTEIALDRIQPIECFRHLKGVTAGSLVNLSPVKPIMVLNTDDKRIIQAVEVLGGFDENTNLAKMDWQDFEILIRDLIQKEFSHEGCKVEVTRASRDAGVDAIAFDEDPIRGGKYVIQAKRYNNLVPLSAVRDLYGTVHNEGAVKGILVTTSHYGGDALEFVKNKPLTLINGEQLIYMFNKHGYKMKIELTKKQRAASSVSY